MAARRSGPRMLDFGEGRRCRPLAMEDRWIHAAASFGCPGGLRGVPGDGAPVATLGLAAVAILAVAGSALDDSRPVSRPVGRRPPAHRRSRAPVAARRRRRGLAALRDRPEPRLARPPAARPSDGVRIPAGDDRGVRGGAAPPGHAPGQRSAGRGARGAGARRVRRADERRPARRGRAADGLSRARGRGLGPAAARLPRSRPRPAGGPHRRLALPGLHEPGGDRGRAAWARPSGPWRGPGIPSTSSSWRSRAAAPFASRTGARYGSGRRPPTAARTGRSDGS